MDAELYRELIAIREDLAELKALARAVEDHKEQLYGNGHDGLIKTVDRLEQSHKTYNRILTAISSVLIGLVGETLWKRLGL